MVQAATPPSQANQAASAITNFLSIAPKKYTTILGTIATGSSGGSSAVAVWQQQIPIVPAFCTAVDYEIQIPLTATPSVAKSVVMSPWAPYSAISNQLTLGGAPPWPLTELTPWYLDNIVHQQEYDPGYPGLGNNVLWFGDTTVQNGITTSFLDQGPYPNKISGTATGLGASPYGDPGNFLSNGTTAVSGTIQFRCRQQLQRKRHLLWGAIPFGDPQNRPANLTTLNALSGNLPEQNLFQTINNTAWTAAPVTNGTTNVYTTYELAYVDLLYPGMQAPPQPTVGYGLQLNQFSTVGLNSGTIYPITHRTAMLYTSIHQLLINGFNATGTLATSQPAWGVEADYYGLWDDQDQQSARWSFDAQVNTFQQWFVNLQRIYNRYFQTGHYFCNFENMGDLPDLPSVSPYMGLMSPDANYAQLFGIPVTPAMTTSVRVPSGTTAYSPYARNYSFGLVKVPY